MFFIPFLNRSGFESVDSLMHDSLTVNSWNVGELYEHYKWIILDKDERKRRVLTKRVKSHKNHTITGRESILLR